MDEDALTEEDEVLIDNCDESREWLDEIIVVLLVEIEKDELGPEGDFVKEDDFVKEVDFVEDVDFIKEDGLVDVDTFN